MLVPVPKSGASRGGFGGEPLRDAELLGARRLPVRYCPSRRFAAVVSDARRDCLCLAWVCSLRGAAGRAGVRGAAGRGACGVLAACPPVQAGAAAIVGDQRITVSSLDTQVSNL